MLSLDGVPPSKPILGNDLLEDTSTRAVRINSLESSSSNLSRTNSLTFGGTRSRENSVSSSEDLDVLLENIDDKFELTAALTRLQTNCNSVAMKLVHLQDELKESVSTAAATTTDSLQKHSDSLQSYSTIVSTLIPPVDADVESPLFNLNDPEVSLVVTPLCTTTEPELNASPEATVIEPATLKP